MSVARLRGRSGERHWLVSERLALRRFRGSDAELLYRLDSDPRVMRYIGNGSVGTRASVSAAVSRSIRYYGTYPGLGVWPAEDRETGGFVGWFCLKYVPQTVEVEVGYRLSPDVWGRGYATEGARALVRYGFADLGLDRIIGLTHPDNAASQRVLQKAGLSDSGWGQYYGRRLRLFVGRRSPATGPAIRSAQDLP
jgi:RimJ/RimL family protein N-acetyltransferase